MVHGDDDGLVLPPKVAPIQVAIIPIAQHKEGVLDKVYEVADVLKKDFRIKVDASDKAPGWKFSEYEMKGVPVRVELGPKDIEKNQCVIVRRDNREKIFVSLDNLAEEVQKALDAVHEAMYEKALKNMEEKTSVATSFEEFLDIAENKPGFIKAMWCGEKECEEKLKEVTGGVKSRCIPFEEEHLADTCVCCGKPAKHMVYWGKQY
jgi:prolyl-tRNA synthetase